MTTRGPLTLHLSRSGVLENAGIVLHPVYGFVYLPGSGIKGLVRAWAETVWAPAQTDKTKAWRRIEEAFGWSPNSESHKFPQPNKGLPGWRPNEIESRKGATVGRLVFHDAWPLCWPRLIVDVVNNHHPKYYADEDDPGDWENPTLVYFLAVGRDEKFEFAISDRKSGDDGLLATACGWLREALTFEGAGAKTAAGYGRFQAVEDKQASIPKTLVSVTYKLRLVSPAFLAGANQKKDDCDLRPAALRGLLRWWWRTMHAGHLDRASLKRLETAVWGDAQSGSPVRIAVGSESDEAPILYDHKDRYKPKSEFQKANDLQNPPNKTTQGLFYVSYGMDDGDRKRWYRAAGTRWSVRIDAKRGHLLSDVSSKQVLIEPEDILVQAVAALWLLCHFGGVGSRGRKGFGSFADIDVKDIANIANADDWQNHAAVFRQKYGLLKQGAAESPSLAARKTIEIVTPWKNPWTALDQLGYAIQDFAQKYVHDERKRGLGLPRTVHGPIRQPMHHQNSATHKPPQQLSANGIRRHAAPIHYHLAESHNSVLCIRASGFPAHRLPKYRESEKLLDELLKFLKQHLNKRTKGNPNIGQKRNRQPQGGVVEQSQTHVQAGDRVEAELLEEKTKKGGWKAKHLESGRQGPIQDSQNVPEDAEPGQHVQLTVVSVSVKEMAFKWAVPLPSKKRPSRHGDQIHQRGRR